MPPEQAEASAAAARGGLFVGRPYVLATIHRDTGEMRELAGTLGLRLLLEVYQNRNRPHPGLFLGRGKLDSLRSQLDEWRAGIVPSDWMRRGGHFVPAPEPARRDGGHPLDADEDESERGGAAERGGAVAATAWGGARWAGEESAGEVPRAGEGELLLVLDEDVRPGVLFNLEERLRVEVWDRTRLILEIFSQHAHLREARLQVELAKLQYEVPLIQEAIHRKMGSERPGFMGGGEYAVADYRDFIKRRMRTIRDELEQVRHDRSVRRKVRRDRFYQVALAGYTNAGKSSLLAALTGADTLQEGALFTTLSTMTRRLDLAPAGSAGGEDRARAGDATRSGEPTGNDDADAAERGGDTSAALPGDPAAVPNVFGGDPSASYGRPILLTDTVGFIRALPSWLLDAFHATLEEIALSDVVLLVVDASDPPPVLVEKVRVCLEELAHLDVTCPVIVVMNKVDRLEAADLEANLEALLAHAQVRRSMVVRTSARTGRGLDRLVARIQAELPPMVTYQLVAPATDAGRRLVSRLYAWGNVKAVDYGMRLVARGDCDPLYWKTLQGEADEAGAELSRRSFS